MTTSALANTDYTNPANYRLQVPSATILPRDVPGIQVDGYFPDTSTFNTNHGWNHDAQFVIRLRIIGTGKLVITGAPGGSRSTPRTPNPRQGDQSKGTLRVDRQGKRRQRPSTTDGTNPGDALASGTASHAARDRSQSR